MLSVATSLRTKICAKAAKVAEPIIAIAPNNSDVLRSPLRSRLGHKTINTPTKPRATVVKRNNRTTSPSMTAAKRVKMSGVVNPSAATSGKVKTPKAKKRKDIAAAPAVLRHKCPLMLDVRKALGKSPRALNQPTTTKRVKNAL